MKTQIITLALALIASLASAQSDTTTSVSVSGSDKNNVTTTVKTVTSGDTTTVITTRVTTVNGNKLRTEVETKSSTADNSWNETSTKTYNSGHWSFGHFNADKHGFESHLGGAFLGVNHYINADGNFDAPADAQWMELNSGRSLNFDLYLDMFGIPSISKNFAIEAGLDFEFNHYSFAKDFVLDVADGKLVQDYGNVPECGFKRSQLRTLYLGLPLMMELQFRNTSNRTVYLSAGVKGQVRIGCRTKQVWKEGDEKFKNKDRQNYNTSLLRYSFIGGIGVGDWQVFGEYCPVSIFEDGKGPELIPFSIGIKYNF